MSLLLPTSLDEAVGMMKDVIRRGTARRALALGRADLAGKTGTTNDHHDAWFCGFNARLVAAVWMGFDQEASLGAGEEGGRTAVPVWVHFMRQALRDTPEVQIPAPDGLVTVKISPETGLLASADDPNAVFETFMEPSARRLRWRGYSYDPTPGQGVPELL